MVSELPEGATTLPDGFVLILVLMEYGLGDAEANWREANRHVLILVLMEYGLGVVNIRVETIWSLDLS